MLCFPFSRRFKDAVPHEVVVVCQTLSQAGYQGFIVGGAIRDALLGQTVSDWDVATDAKPDQVADLFDRVIPNGTRFGTVTVLVNELPIDVTTFRQDGDYLDGRRPSEVFFTKDICADLARRDFTINAIAYSPIHDQLIDPFHGTRDIRHRRLRTVGDAKERFSEDGLRIMRLFRFVATLGFRPEKKTLEAVDPQLLCPISKERIGAELAKLLLGSHVREALLLMHRSGVLSEILPELAQGDGLVQGDFHRFDVLRHSIEAAALAKDHLHLRLAALLHDVGKPPCFSRDARGIHFYGHDVEGSKIANEILRRLRFDGKTRCKVTHLIRWHMFSLHGYSSDRAVRRLISKVGRDSIDDLLELRRADIAASASDMRQAFEHWQRLRQRVDEVLQAESVFSVQDLAINGRDVMKLLGIKPGPKVGEILRILHEKVLDDPSLNTREKLTAMAVAYCHQAGQDGKGNHTS